MPKSEKVNGNGYQKVTNVEKQNRIEISATWILENPDSSWIDFIKWANAKWNYQKNQANIYWKAAKTYLNETIHDDAESARKVAEASLKRQLKKLLAEELPDYKMILEYRKELNKISGVYTQKIEINDITEQPIFNTDVIKASEKDDGE